MKTRLVLMFCAVVFCLAGAASGEVLKNLTADELKAMLDKNGKPMLVDSRSAAEYSAGHIPGAVNIPPEKIGVIGSLLPDDKKTPLVFYCRGGS